MASIANFVGCAAVTVVAAVSIALSIASICIEQIMSDELAMRYRQEVKVFLDHHAFIPKSPSLTSRDFGCDITRYRWVMVYKIILSALGTGLAPAFSKALINEASILIRCLKNQCGNKLRT